MKVLFTFDIHKINTITKLFIILKYLVISFNYSEFYVSFIKIITEPAFI